MYIKLYKNTVLVLALLVLRNGTAVAQSPRLVASRRLGQAEAVLPARRRRRRSRRRLLLLLMLLDVVVVVDAVGAVVAAPPRGDLLLDREVAARRAVAGENTQTGSEGKHGIK